MHSLYFGSEPFGFWCLEHSYPLALSISYSFSYDKQQLILDSSEEYLIIPIQIFHLNCV